MPTRHTRLLPGPRCECAPVLWLSLAFKRVLNSECFKKCHKWKFSQGGKQKGKCCCHWSTRGPPKGSPPLSITALIVASLGAGWGSLQSSLPLPGIRKFLPISVFPGGRCHKAFVNCVRCGDTAHSGLIPIILFHTLSQASGTNQFGDHGGPPARCVAS